MRRSRLVSHDGCHQKRRRVSSERPLPRRHLVENAPEREHIAPGVDASPLHLFRRHVRWSPDDVPRLGEGTLLLPSGCFRQVRGLDELRQSPVQNLHRPVLLDDDVVGLQVPVDDAPRVGRREPVRDLDRIVQSLREREPAGSFAEELPEGLPRNVLHHDEVQAIGLGDVENGDDVRMVERRCRASLLEEPPPPLGILRDFPRKELDGDGAVELRVEGSVDVPHSARAYPLVDAVMKKHLPGVHVRRRLCGIILPADVNAQCPLLSPFRRPNRGTARMNRSAPGLHD